MVAPTVMCSIILHIFFHVNPTKDLSFKLMALPACQLVLVLPFFEYPQHHFIFQHFSSVSLQKSLAFYWKMVCCFVFNNSHNNSLKKRIQTDNTIDDQAVAFIESRMFPGSTTNRALASWMPPWVEACEVWRSGYDARLGLFRGGAFSAYQDAFDLKFITEHLGFLRE